MNFDIDPREINLQGPDGMQLVKLLRKLIAAEDSGGGGDEPVPTDVSDLFYCEYGVTTLVEIRSAIADGKLPVCKRLDSFYYLINTTSAKCTFACFNSTANTILILNCKTTGWDNMVFTPQSKLTWDYAPTQGSTNPVTSGGVWSAIQQGGGVSNIDPYQQYPEMDGVASPGSSDDYARGDHVHPTDTSRAAVSDIPTKVSDLQNDSGFVNQNQAAAAAPIQSVNGQTGVVTVNPATDAQVKTATDAWLAENVLQETGYVLDASLTLDNAASPANKVGEIKTIIATLLSKNKIDMNAVARNYMINNNSTSPNYGKLYPDNAYTTTDFIPVSKGDYVRLYYSPSSTPVEGSTLFALNDTALRIAEYDKDRNIIYCSANWVAFPYTVSTDGAAFIRVSAPTKATWMLFVNYESSAQPYYLAYKPEWSIISDLEDIFNPAEVIVPSMLCGVTGQEINVYKENLVAGNRLKSLAYIHTTLPNDAIQSDSRAIWNPSTTALTETMWKWEIFKYGLENQPEIKPVKVCNVPKATGNASIKVLVIGDSKVAGGYVTYHFLHSFDDDDMSCTLLGTQYSWTQDNRHEGYGSRTAQWMCTNASSPFCNNGAFDFANYLSANSIATPDYVFINLGTNDASQASSGYAENFVTYVTQMVNGIHSVSSSIKVIVGLCEGVCTTQDTNNASFLNWDVNRKISIIHKAAIAAFDNRASENIYVCPMYMGIDLTQDYRMNEVPLSQRDGDVNHGSGDGKMRMQVIDTVHQSEVGYWKNADYMYALTKYITAKSL